MNWLKKSSTPTAPAVATTGLHTISLQITCTDAEARQVQEDLESLIKYMSAEDIRRLAVLMASPVKRNSARSALYSNT